MKLTTGIVAMAMMVGGAAVAQNPDAIDNARKTVKSLQQQQATKPTPAAPAAMVKPAALPAAKTAVKSASIASDTNKLQHVNVVPGANDIQIEISSSQAVTPRVSKLSSPARVLVELPETVVASSPTKIPVGTGGVKGVRIGMDGKTPPTTSVVVDLDKALAYEVAPGPAGKTILILHTQDTAAAVAKNAPAPAKTAVVAGKPQASPKIADAKAPATKAPSTTPAPVRAAQAKGLNSTPVAIAKADAKIPGAKAPAAKAVAVPVKADVKQQPGKTLVAAKASPAAAAAPVKVAEAPKHSKPEEKKWAMTGNRDPFFSPVVQQHGSGCATGKKCLEIGAINLRGVVKSDTGFIAVVTNNLNKAYFLRENDPVFNGYVVKITGDSVVFQETILDKLGKSFTREIVKRIIAPAV
jgi:Tfp pilus assembly protein PilP